MSDTGNGHPRGLLSEYLDDELGIEQRASIDRHLAACEDCRAHLDGLRRLARAVAEEGVPPVPVDLAARIGRRLDAATIVRPRRSRMVVPATIAATLGAIGILVALQWREGRLGAPVPTERVTESRVRDEAEPTNAPSFVVVPEEKAASRQDKDLLQAVEPAIEKKLEKEADGVEGGVEGGVPGGVPGGVVGGVVGGIVGGGEERERAAATGANESARAMQPTQAQAPAPVPVAKSVAEAEPSCMNRWSDSGLRGNWNVPDVYVAERELGRVAHSVSGIGLWRGVAEGRPYVVVVPRAHFEEVFYALRARGVTGFPETPPPAEGTDCAGISITLTVVPPDTPPAPR